jgi:hypothetical protein
MVEGINRRLKEFEIKLISAEHSGTLHHHIFFYPYEGGPEMDEAAEVQARRAILKMFLPARSD